MLANQPECTGVIDTRIAFESSRTNPRLEIADPRARESMKEPGRTITNAPRPMRCSRRLLDETGRFVFIEHGRSTGKNCETWRSSRSPTPCASNTATGYEALAVRRGGRPTYNRATWILPNIQPDNRRLEKAVDAASPNEGQAATRVGQHGVDRTLAQNGQTPGPLGQSGRECSTWNTLPQKAIASVRPSALNSHATRTIRAAI